MKVNWVINFENKAKKSFHQTVKKGTISRFLRQTTLRSAFSFAGVVK